MPEVSAQLRIEAPAEKVWATLTDFSPYGDWNATHTGFPHGGPASLEAGTTYQENMKLMGFPAEVTWTVEEYEPARLLTTRGKGPMGVRLATRYALTPDGDATTVRVAFTGGLADGRQAEGLGSRRAGRVAAQTRRAGRLRSPPRHPRTAVPPPPAGLNPRRPERARHRPRRRPRARRGSDTCACATR